MTEILVIGVGQTLRGDDGAGPAAVQFWLDHYLTPTLDDAVQVLIEELPGLTLVEYMRGRRAVILVDALLSDAPPGTIRLLEESQLASFLSGSASAHGLGVSEALALGRSLYPDEMPPRLFVIAIAAVDVRLGEDLSVAVKAALPKAALRIQALVESLLSTPAE
ncbi:MAG: hydrogenase maturation protease [Chloroflexi bacterium]|nr:hydrogenase maturation protease [Chloroflexota bacterium]